MEGVAHCAHFTAEKLNTINPSSVHIIYVPCNFTLCPVFYFFATFAKSVCLLLSPQAAMCYVHVAALVAEYLHRKSKALETLTCAHTHTNSKNALPPFTAYTCTFVIEHQAVSAWY